MSEGIFSIISRNELADILETLYQLTNLSIRLIDADGSELLSFGDKKRFCQIVTHEVFRPSACTEVYQEAGITASRLGESYIFNCPANLNHIIFPFTHENTLLASVLIGPFLIDQPDSTLMAGMMENYSLSPSLALDLYDELSLIPVVPPEKVTNLSKLIAYLFSSYLPSEKIQMRHAREKISQQSRINETVQMYKLQHAPASRKDLYEKENALLTKAKTGNIQETKALLNELLGYVLFTEGGRVETVRLRAIELTTLLSRAAMECGARSGSVYSLNDQYLPLLSRQQSFDEISLLLQNIVESFMEIMFHEKDKGNAHIRRAMQFISSNYAFSLSVSDVASELNLSPGYFASLFKNTVGESFHTYLMRVRVEESKRLLLSTNDSLTDIAVALGFSDQSYFCRVFRKFVGMTPGKFRS